MEGCRGSVGATSSLWWTDERARLYEWLQKTAPELATVYVGGLRVLMDEELPGRVHFAAHAMREIANRLRDVLTGTDAKRPQYEHLLALIIHENAASRVLGIPVGLICRFGVLGLQAAASWGCRWSRFRCSCG
ncbi:MAG: hypothetical protein OXB99_00420, partial [Acidimicrobiaceae bacterium]|nr:hypothetical protein [Acidimicrobiaceae bacterium]